jgi:hypothetical protein
MFSQPINTVNVSEKQKIRKNVCLMQFSYPGIELVLGTVKRRTNMHGDRWIIDT